MIKNIRIKNFKSLKNENIDFANLNILTGLNGIGKSSIVQTLLLLRQSRDVFSKKQKYLNLQGNLVNIGSYNDAIHFLYERKEDYIKLDFQFDSQNISLKTKSYTKYPEEAENIQVPITLSSIKSETYKEALFSQKKFQYLTAERISDVGRYQVNNIHLENKDFGINGEYAWQYFVENRLKKIANEKLKHQNEDSLLLRDQINAWLGEISPNIEVNAFYDPNDSTKVIAEYQFRFLNEANVFDSTPAFKPKNVGFGISYIFSVLLALLTAEKEDLLIIENPESHLHPKGQSKVAELMCLVAQNDVQIFCETHSDHIINGTRVGVVSENIDFEKVKIHYLYKENDTLTTKVEEIKIDKNAKLEYNENTAGFFDQIQIDLRKIRNK